MARALNKEATPPRPFSDFELVAQAWSFVIASQTTAVVLAFAVHFLATHPAAEAALLAELDTFDRGARGRAEVLADHLGRLPFLRAVLQETMRLLPVVPLTIREADRDVALPASAGGLTVPAGTQLAVSIFALHRDARLWPRAGEFVPERFLGEFAREAYMPFGDGARSCIGQKLAWQQATICLARLYRRHTFALVAGQVPLAVRMSLALAPAKGVHVTVRERKPRR